MQHLQSSDGVPHETPGLTLKPLVTAASIESHELFPDRGQARLSGALDHEPANDVMADYCLDSASPNHPH